MTKPLNEKEEFSLRLKKALKRSPKKVETPTELALQFNLRWNGEPISQQAAQKWLSGQARPTLDKIEVLSDWLNVSAQWLRLGIAEEQLQTVMKKGQKAKATAITPLSQQEMLLIDTIRNLPEHRRFLVTEIVEQFSIEQEMWLKG